MLGKISQTSRLICLLNLIAIFFKECITFKVTFLFNLSLFNFGEQYWHNKFVNDASKDTSGGSTASVPQIEAEVHF